MTMFGTRIFPAVGDVVDVPGIGPVIVTATGPRYFTGHLADGTSIGRTGNGIATRERLGS
jgi:hypothetical protein